MKITPLEIRQRTFEKVFRGYDKDEVTAFLTSLSQEWETLVNENRELKIRLENSANEVKKLREVENSLYKTLKTAEDTGASMIDQAEKRAALNVKESELKAEETVNTAREKAKTLVENAEQQARQILSSMEHDLLAMQQQYKSSASAMEDMLYGLRNLANETLQKADKYDKQLEKSVDHHLKAARELSGKQQFSSEETHTNGVQGTNAASDRFETGSDETPAPDNPPEPEPKENRSFFDDID